MKTNTATGSLERFIRTFMQIAVADSAAFPALLAAFNISPTLAAKVIGVVNAIVLAIVAIQNGLESKGVVPAMLRYVPPTTPPASPTVGTNGVGGGAGGASTVTLSYANGGGAGAMPASPPTGGSEPLTGGGPGTAS